MKPLIMKPFAQQYFISTTFFVMFCLFLATGCKKAETSAVTPAAGKSDKKEMTNLKIGGIADITVTLNTGNTYSILVPANTDVKALKLSFTLSAGAKSNPESGSAQDFTKTVKYVVTAEDGSTITYTVLVIPKPLTNYVYLESFTLDGITPKVEGVIDVNNNKVYLLGFNDIPVTSLKPTIKVTNGDNVSPASGVAQDFSKPVVYKLTAGDGSTKQVEVSVIKSKINSQSKRILYYTYEKTLQAVNAFNGSSVWTYSNGSQFSSPTFGGGNMYVGDAGKKVTAVNAETGKKVWEFTASDQVDQSPTYGDGSVYFSANIFIGNSSTESYFYALDATTGTKTWEYKYGGHLRGNPLYIDNKVIFNTDNLGILCLNTKSGQLLWSGLGASEFSSAGLTNNSYNLFYDGKSLVHGNVFLDINTGKQSKYVGNIDTKGSFFNNKNYTARNPVIEGNILYINNYDSEVVAFDLLSNSVKWRVQLPKTSGLLNNDLLLDNGVIYTYDSKFIYALNKDNGTTIWQSPDITSTRYPFEKDYFMVGDGILYVWTADSILGFDVITGKPVLRKNIYTGYSEGLPILLENSKLIGVYPASSGSNN